MAARSVLSGSLCPSRNYRSTGVCVTLGARGCALFVDGKYIEAPATPFDVVHPVGTGDAVTAALIHGLASEWPVDRMATFANRLGAFVAGSPAAIPDWQPS